MQPPHNRPLAAPRIIKRYARSRLYDAAARRYVTVDQLRAMIEAGTRVIVTEAANGRDITRSVLMH
jgi:polyhydroxyalkanoate synthesis regulator protein